MLGSKIDTREMRKKNRELILKMIYKTGVISRANLSKQLGLSKPSVNEHVDFLLGTGIIHEIGVGSANERGGRKPILIAPNENYRYNIAIDLGLSKPIAALGNMLTPAVEKVMIDMHGKEGSLNQKVKLAIDWLIHKRGIADTAIGVIVICAPGIARENRITFRNKQHELTYDSELFDFLRKEYGKVVLIKNDVNTAVLAEKELLEPVGKRDYAVLACGNGFGAGIMINNQLLEGRHQAAGEVGFMFAEVGKLEEAITIQPFLRRIKEVLGDYPDSCLNGKEAINFEEAREAYEHGDQAVQAVLREIGHKMGICANNVTAILDLELILLGGDYLAFQDILIPEMKKVIDASGFQAKPEIRPSSLGHNSGVIGCMNIAREYLINHVEKENGGINDEKGSVYLFGRHVHQFTGN